jgi:hypothetical protein
MKGIAMTIGKSVGCIIAITSLSFVPLHAQTTATSATETVGLNPAAQNPTSSASTMKSTTTTKKTTTSVKSTTKKKTTSASSKQSIWNDATRISGLLQDAQTNVNVPASTWTVVSQEANTLANRIYGHTTANTTARKSATNLRTHVWEMRKAAMAADAAGARQHASEAQPFANELIDWSAAK